MASTKKPSPAQIAARKAFAERARSGAFKRRKKVATSKRTPLAFGGMTEHGKLKRDTNYEQAYERSREKKPKRKATKPPSPAQLAARAKFVKMVRARAAAKKGNPTKRSTAAKMFRAGSRQGKGSLRKLFKFSSGKTKRSWREKAKTSRRGAQKAAATSKWMKSVFNPKTKANSRGLSSRAPAWTRSKAKQANPMFDVWGSKVSKKSGLARGKSKKLGQVKAWTQRGARRKAKRGLGSGFSFNVIGTKKSARYVRRRKKKGGILGRLFNPTQRAALRELAMRDNPGRVRFSESDLAKYAGKIKGLSGLGSTSRVSAPKRRRGGRFKKPAKQALARAFSGSGLLGLGRSRKTVRANVRKANPFDLLGKAEGRRPRKRFFGYEGKGTSSGSLYDRQVPSAWRAIEKSIKRHKRKKKKRNPSPASVFSEFRGKDVRSKARSTAHGSGHLTVAQLGHLRELRITGKRLSFGGNALLCADGRKRLHIAGVRMKAAGGGEQDMGEVHSVTYRSDKPHIEEGTFDYVHKFGEDGGKRPRLIIDAEGYPFLEGGSYKIDADGIIN